MLNQITCPHCGEAVSVDEVLSHQIRESVSKEYQDKVKLIETDSQKKVEEAITKQRQTLQKELEEENAIKMKSAEAESKQKDKKLDEFQQEILNLLKEKSSLEQQAKETELKVAREIDQARGKIREEAQKQMSEEFHLKEMEKEKTINDLKKALEDARRRAEQGSQQLQGEILELDLEEILKMNFPQDTITPVAKGVKGGDLLQIVRSPSGSTDCGQILWEIKRTKNWTEGWISKLKSDKRQSKANLAAIITTALPKEAGSGLGLKDGIWVCSYLFVIPLSTLLRKALLDSAYQKAAASHQGRKADLVYEYVTSHQFQQQIEGMVEVYKEMQDQVQKERTAFERSWKQREGQLQRFILSTANIYGSMQGLAGSQALPQLKGLSLELEDGNEDTS